MAVPELKREYIWWKLNVQVSELVYSIPRTFNEKSRYRWLSIKWDRGLTLTFTDSCNDNKSYTLKENGTLHEETKGEDWEKQSNIKSSIKFKLGYESLKNLSLLFVAILKLTMLFQYVLNTQNFILSPWSPRVQLASFLAHEKMYLAQHTVYMVYSVHKEIFRDIGENIKFVLFFPRNNCTSQRKAYLGP